MQLASKILFTFNTFYSSFLREVKSSDDSIKSKIKAHYKVILKGSAEYIEFFWGDFSKHASEITDTNENVLEAHVFKEVKLGDIVAKVSDENKVLVWNYVYILSALAMVYNSIEKTEKTEKKVTGEASDAVSEDDVPELTPLDDASNEDEAVFSKTMKIFDMAQKGMDISSELNDILDDDLRCVLSRVKSVARETPSAGATGSETSGDDVMNMFASFENSKICNLAKEISNEIDVSKLKIDSPQDVMKLLDFSNNNNVLGNIIGKVSSKMQEKISTGEIKHEDLLGEAMSMLNVINKSGAGSGMAANLFNNPMMADMMKHMKKGKVSTKSDVLKKESTREKLRKKLEERRKT